MEMTFDQYIVNPMGKGSAMSNTGIYRDLYTKKLDALILRENGNFKYKLYTDKDDYYIHIKIPSEKIEKFYYDIVVRLFTDDPKFKSDNNLKRYNVQFFSNDPSFMFTFAYAFNKHNMFIDFLSPKMSKKALKKRPDEKNPNAVTGYVKSLYFTYLIMQDKGLFDRIGYSVYGKPLDKKALLKEVEDSEIVLTKRQAAEEKLSLEKAKEKARKKKLSSRETSTDLPPIYNQRSERVGTVGKTKKANTVSKTKKIKRY